MARRRAGLLCVPERVEPIDQFGPDVIERLKESLQSAGIVVLRGNYTPADLVELGNRLGTPYFERAVFVDESVSNNVRHPDPVPFHTDSTKANIIGWYCVRPCRTRAPAIYLDARHAYEQLSVAQRKQLQRVYCQFPTLGGVERAPVVRIQDGRPRFFWAEPTLLPAPRSARSAVERFRRGVSGKGAALHIVTLEQGEIVLINNNLLLHGRGTLPADSERCFYQLWINTDGWASASRRRIRRPAPLRKLMASRGPTETYLVRRRGKLVPARR